MPKTIDIFKFLVLMVSLQVAKTQFADESVIEDSIYSQKSNENTQVKINTARYFQRVLEEETLTSVLNLEESSQKFKPASIDVSSKEGEKELTPRDMYQNFFRENESFEDITESANRALKVGNLILKESFFSQEEVSGTLRSLQAPALLCPYRGIPPCLSSDIYRRIDGTCTNLKTPHWGKTNLPYKRFLAPRYENGFDEVQTTGVTGLLLPNPRLISLSLCNDNLQFDIARTSINAAFGQFIDHDFTAIASNPISCKCDDPNPECLSIPTPLEDALNKNDQQCMTQTRSAASFTNINCGISHREQMNTLTSTIDLSQVYGNDVATNTLVRQFSGGLLKSVNKGINNRELLPGFGQTICRDETADKPCFLTGDKRRANINMHLASLHTLWLREHNRIARKLKELNPLWDDEKLFQEARRINIAQTQNIIYSEWLPLIIGWNAIAKYDLLSSGNGFYNDYNDNVDVGVYNEFTAAAFRLHTLVRTTFSQIHPSHATKTLTLQDITFRAVHAYENSGVDGLITGALVDTIGKFDSSFTDGLQNRLFEVPNNQNQTVKRFDLAAMNINRCRDHGCAPYIKYREWCGLGLAKKFSDLVEIDPQNQAKLESIYKDVSNIELFVGGISEKSLPGAIVGPTFSCMIGRQFRNFKRGDRFFFENPDSTSPKPFTLGQLNELHKITFASILCENVDALTSVQPNAFLSSAIPGNAKISCNQVPKLNLNLF